MDDNAQHGVVLLLFEKKTSPHTKTLVDVFFRHVAAF